MPCYRDAPRAIEGVQSILAQDHTDWEVIVIDDGSDTRTQNMLREGVAKIADPRIRLVISAQNRGAARARNLGIRLARGRYICFLDGDDLWEPPKLSQQLSAMMHSGAKMSCTAYRNLDEGTGQSSVRVPPQQIDYDMLLGRNDIGCSTVMIDRAQLGRTYFPLIRMRQDFAHWLAITRRGVVVEGLSDPLTIRRIYPGSLSANKMRAVYYTWRMYREIEGLSLPRTIFCFGRYFLSGVLGRFTRAG